MDSVPQFEAEKCGEVLGAKKCTESGSAGEVDKKRFLSFCGYRSHTVHHLLYVIYRCEVFSWEALSTLYIIIWILNPVKWGRRANKPNHLSDCHPCKRPSKCFGCSGWWAYGPCAELSEGW